MTNSEQGRSFQDVDKGKQTVTTVNRSQSPDGSKPSNKDDNRADDRYGNYNSEDGYAYFMFWWFINHMFLLDSYYYHWQSKVCTVQLWDD